jgi:hypothetical protein
MAYPQLQHQGRRRVPGPVARGLHLPAENEMNETLQGRLQCKHETRTRAII